MARGRVGPKRDVVGWLQKRVVGGDERCEVANVGADRMDAPRRAKTGAGTAAAAVNDSWSASCHGQFAPDSPGWR